jgi:hypothetical protein
MIVKGHFDISMKAEPPFDVVDGVALARARFDKRFFGPLDGTGEVQMLSARTAVPDSAGYVAVERISGSVEGRPGTFVALHTGLMAKGTRSLSITIVPDSGTGELSGIAGRMDIEIVDGKHHYELDYSLVVPR